MEDIYNVETFPWNDYLVHSTVKKRGKQQYIAEFGTFDIETTTIIPENDIDKPFAFMYIWQFCLDGKIVIGRTWEEYTAFIDKIVEVFHTSLNKRFVIYVHFLSFEFQFISRFFEWEQIFATAKRRVVRALTVSGIEYRCSWILSNMSLAQFCSTSKLCVHKKIDSENFDYKKIRTKSSNLLPIEIEYCINDVLGLYECILSLLEDDTLATIPLTSTGYVRRDCRRGCYGENFTQYRELFDSLRLNAHEYELCKKAFGGGDVHANRYAAGSILTGVQSKDMQSAYPAVMCTEYFPMSAYVNVDLTTTSDNKLSEYIETKCCLMTVGFYGVNIKTDQVIPYIHLSKCEEFFGESIDNGRVLSCDFCNSQHTKITR